VIASKSEPEYHAARKARKRDELFAKPGSARISILCLEVAHVSVGVEPWPQSNQDAAACVCGAKRRRGGKRIERIG